MMNNYLNKKPNEVEIMPAPHKAKLLNKDGATSNKWIHGTFIQHTSRQLYPLGGDYYKKEDIANLMITEGFADWGLPTQLQFYPVDEKTICRYTGFVLKGYGKLFTNDIVKDQYGNSAVVKYGIYNDEYNNKRIGFYFDFKLDENEKNNFLNWKDITNLNENVLSGLTYVGNLFDTK